ncbi:contractile injection system protein, VgrG/Pvc8 family, partial [Ralstonia pseudosolanacearum]|uniref:contractile injection system protein, VgrG/Pvc8 family n=1 Tax=Ralstonia pseudosolanacearum TaxID=1310165 RepID=UPI0020041599
PGTTRKRRKTCSIGTSFPRCGNLEQDGSRFHSRTPLISVSLAYRRDNYLFHGKSVEDQTDLIFGDYHDIQDWKTKALGQDEPMTDACQFDETDYNYVHRRWEARGWLYWYEHRKDGHTLVLCGDSTRTDPIDGGGEMVWQGRSGVTECGLTSFSPVRSVAATAYAASSFDFKNPRPVRADGG